ncbi:MAG TPA: hypothetical protein VK891_17105 [Euzebyales bacterium]|nr:hypothetical protein [Euzebyales bacterium]
MDTDTLRGQRRRLLHIYLNDHLTGAAGAIDLARRCQRSNRGTPLGTFLQGLLAEIIEDRGTLEQVMARLHMPADRLKLVAATVAEKVSRLKLNGQILGYSDLSRIVELEALCGGVALKRRLWHALTEIRDVDPVLAEIDFTHLSERANAQLDGLEHHRLEAVARAFTP